MKADEIAGKLILEANNSKDYARIRRLHGLIPGSLLDGNTNYQDALRLTMSLAAARENVVGLISVLTT